MKSESVICTKGAATFGINRSMLQNFVQGRLTIVEICAVQISVSISQNWPANVVWSWRISICIAYMHSDIGNHPNLMY